MLAVIGGSGFESFDEFKTVRGLERSTPFGDASSGLRVVSIDGQECLFLSRHGDHHELLPSEVNYRANIYALKRHGAQAIVAFSAVGSLEKDCRPGDLVIPRQYIDRTKSLRAHSFCGKGIIGHVSLAKPICAVMEGHAVGIAPSMTFSTHFGKTYICIEGPYFSTQAESHAHRGAGAQIIGMTNFPEYALAREAGLPYLPCCFVTDYDCWDDSIPHVTVEEVIRVMKGNNEKGFSFLRRLLALGPRLWEGSEAPNGGLRTGLFMPKDRIPADQREWIEVLLS